MGQYEIALPALAHLDKSPTSATIGTGTISSGPLGYCTYAQDIRARSEGPSQILAFRRGCPEALALGGSAPLERL